MNALKKEEGERKRGENIKDCIFNFHFQAQGHYLPDFLFNSRGNVVLLKAQLLKVDSTSLAPLVLPETFKESLFGRICCQKV